ncbi:MAG: leucine-rich repeat domain-containing protein [Turicibacter sp.]|nr:leucine-rich repeat domain-containing protein [Turicibacter sp.]
MEKINRLTACVCVFLVAFLAACGNAAMELEEEFPTEEVSETAEISGGLSDEEIRNLPSACSATANRPPPTSITIRGQVYDVELDSLLLRTLLPSAPLTNEDIVPLAYMTNLTTLRLGIGEITDLTPLAGLTNLRFLDLSLGFGEISDISPLAELVNLEQLILRLHNIEDLTPLASLHNLRFLQLDHNAISDISPLAALTNLEFLDLSGNPEISDLTPLAELRNLTSLRIVDLPQITDLTAVADLQNLRRLSVGIGRVDAAHPLDISAIAKLENLRELDITGTQLSDISPLANLRNLTRLSLLGNEITDISPLANLQNLTTLGLSNEQISDISALAHLNKWTLLALWDNPIDDWSPVDHVLRVDGRTVAGELTMEYLEELRADFFIFAMAIEDFYGGAHNPLEISNWDSPMFAHLVDLDGNGTIGVLAVRPEQTDYGIFSVGRIFYIYNGEIAEKDLGFLEGFPSFVAAVTEPLASGLRRPILIGGDARVVHYTVFDLVDGRLVEDFTIAYEMWDDGEIWLIDGGLVDDSVLELWSSISEEESLEISERYGLDSLILEIPDHTMLIISMAGGWIGV